MFRQRNYSIREKLIQYLVFTLLFITVAGFMFVKHKRETEKAFFDYYLGTFYIDVDSGSIPETGERNE